MFGNKSASIHFKFVSSEQFFLSILWQEIGLALGYDTSNNATLWKDRVALEMNAAVLHSFKLANATIVDQVVSLREK